MSDDERREPAPETGEGAPAPEGEFSIDLASLTEDDVRELLEKASEAATLLDRLQRLQAEHENYRKRMAKEMAGQRRWALRDFLADLLPVADNLERALEAPAAGEGAEAVQDGVRMVLEILRGVFAAHGVTAIEALGKAFDPAVHEAVGPVVTPDLPAGAVGHVLLKGYRLGDLVVRPSRVLVARPPAPQEGS